MVRLAQALGAKNMIKRILEFVDLMGMVLACCGGEASRWR